MKVIKNQLRTNYVRRTFFSGSTNKTRTMFAKQRFAQLRTGITTVISLDRCTEIRSASSLEQPVRAEFGGRVPEREAEWRKGAGNGAEWRNGAGKGAEWRKGARNGGTVMGGCRKWRHSGGRMPESEAWCVPDTSIKFSPISAPTSVTISATTSRAHSATLFSLKSKNLKQD